VFEVWWWLWSAGMFIILEECGRGGGDEWEKGREGHV